MDKDTSTLRGLVNSLCSRQRVRQYEIARCLGISGGMFNHYLSGRAQIPRRIADQLLLILKDLHNTPEPEHPLQPYFKDTVDVASIDLSDFNE